MIYIYEYEMNRTLLPYILDQLAIDYNIIECCSEELVKLLDSKDFEAVYISEYFSRLINDKQYIDFAYNSNGEIIYHNLEYLAMKKFIENLKFDFNNKVVLLLGSNNRTNMIYKILKEISNCKVFISSITEEYSKLEAGDRKIKKIEIKNLEKVDCIINSTNLGAKNQENECMLEDFNVIKASFLIDLINYPIKTTLQRKYEHLYKIKTINGFGVQVYKCLISLSMIKNNYSYLDKYDIILKKLEKKFNDINIDENYEVV